MTATDISFSDPEEIEPQQPKVVERYRAQEFSTSYRLQVLIGRFADRAATAGVVALTILPFMLLGVLFVDVPARIFDGWAAMEGLRPSQWLSRGDLFMAVSIFMLTLMTRRHGGQVAVQALSLAWIAVVGLSILMLIYLAPQLEAGDLPNGRYTLGFISGWYAAAFVAVSVYDLTRGSRWWRPPFLAIGAGLATQSVIYFFVVFAATGAPWIWWLGANLVTQLAMAGLFTLAYRFLRGRFRPRAGRASGYGGL
ncbi:MAG: hypothetical protein AAGA69_10565 [Pseudomonadota bacterium]